MWNPFKRKPPAALIPPTAAIPNNREDLISFAAKELPWEESRSGYAVIPYTKANAQEAKTPEEAEKAKRHLAIITRCTEETPPLMGLTKTRSGLGYIAIDVSLEAAVNKKWNLSCHAIADRTKGENDWIAKASAQDLIDRGNSKRGPEVS